MVDNLKLCSIDIGRIIVDNESNNENNISWTNILEAFDFECLLEENRLVRSQYWGDSDYESCVIETLSDALHVDKNEACKMIEYILTNFTDVSKEEINNIMSNLNDNNYIVNNTSDNNIDDLINDINNSISEGKPVFALDRLHTLMIKYIKELCLRHGVEIEEKIKLDAVLKKYLKCIDEFIDSGMTKSILKSNMSLFSKFNHVRNNYTYTHDNNILNDIEGKLIFKNIVNVKEFIDDIELKIVNQG